MGIVTATWRKQPGDFFCISTKTVRGGEWKDHFFHRDELHLVDEFIRDNGDKNLYWCPHGFSKKRRLKQYAVLPKLLWADLDNVDPRKLNGTKPTLAWESSPKRYAAVWHLDQTMTEDLNRQLTMTLGADRGGWDLTQVLRVPGSVNYKYGKGVPGKKLWWETQPIKVEKLKKHLNPSIGTRDGEGGYSTSKSEARKVYEKYAKRMKPDMRKMILAERAVGDRSKVLWHMGQGLMNLGLSREEWLCLVSSTVWNKFEKHPRQLEREYDKIVGERLPGARAADLSEDEQSGESIYDFEGSLKRLDTVNHEDVNWLIPGWIARGEITIVEGDPGIGKSWFVQYLGMLAIKGKRLKTHHQYMKRRPNPTSVLYIDMENSVSVITKPRMTDLGLSDEEQRRFFVYDKPLSLSDPDAVEAMRSYLEKVRGTPNEVGMIAFDTINVYMGDADTHKAAEVAQSLSHLTQIARDFNLAVVVIRHLTKGSQGSSALYRGQGSMAFAGSARMVMRIAKHPVHDDGTLVAKIIKTNISKFEPALCWTLVEGDRMPGRDHTPTWIEIGEFDTDLKDDDLGKADDKKKGDKGDPLTDAKIWLQAKLDAEGTCFLVALHDEMKKRNKPFTEKVLDKAANELGVRKKKIGNSWKWSLK